MNGFSASASVRAGWHTFKKRPWFFIGVTALIMVISWGIGAVAGLFGEDGNLGLLGGLVNFALGALLSMGVAATMLRAHAAPESAQISDLWHPDPYLKFLAAELLVTLTVLFGFILLIVPGVIAILMFLFVPYIVIEKKLGPIEAMKESMRLTKGSRWELLLFLLIVLALNIVGALALLVGLLVSVPVTTLALVQAYRTLQGKAA